MLARLASPARPCGQRMAPLASTRTAHGWPRARPRAPVPPLRPRRVVWQTAHSPPLAATHTGQGRVCAAPPRACARPAVGCSQSARAPCRGALPPDHVARPTAADDARSSLPPARRHAGVRAARPRARLVADRHHSAAAAREVTRRGRRGYTLMCPKRSKENWPSHVHGAHRTTDRHFPLQHDRPSSPASQKRPGSSPAGRCRVTSEPPRRFGVSSQVPRRFGVTSQVPLPWPARPTLLPPCPGPVLPRPTHPRRGRAAPRPRCRAPHPPESSKKRL